MRLTDLIGLDFETYSPVNLPKHGLHRYVNHPLFRPLLASVSWNDGTLQPSGTERLDFVRSGHRPRVARLRQLIDGKMIVAHNAGFEQAVLRRIGIDVPSNRFIDSAVLARAYGAGGKLEAAAPQILGVDKLEDGKRLIMLFAVPGPYQEKNQSLAFDPRIVDDNLADWLLFGRYCNLDSELGLRIANAVIKQNILTDHELTYQAVTMDMNAVGWPVDRRLVEEMQRRYLENVEAAKAAFLAKYEDDINLASPVQLQKWCAKRGIKATSFDEQHVAKMIPRIEQRLEAITSGRSPALVGKVDGYVEVLDLLKTKQVIGGSSLKKLQTILDTLGVDGRLHDQYLHIGAGASFRTTGKGVQMQNLKRLSGEPDDMLELIEDVEAEWSNDQLANNIRQVFTSSHRSGALIVGDFASVESRGLAWLAGARWKLDAYRQGKDMYRVLAASMFGKSYDQIGKHSPERQAGKVGELACGYQAAGGAVQSFAAGMGIEMSEGEADKLVSDWRRANPEILDLWARLNDALLDGLNGSIGTLQVGPQKDWNVQVTRITTPASLLRQHPGAQSLAVSVFRPNGDPFLTRVIHGCYMRGNSICYYKPSELKSGDLWKNHYKDPKTKDVKFFSIYGGKLAGILTQSFCRELFFSSLQRVATWTGALENIDLIGQFHDEIVLDWRPPPAGPAGQLAGFIRLQAAMSALQISMSETDVEDFPLAAEIKHDYRYIK